MAQPEHGKRAEHQVQLTMEQLAQMQLQDRSEQNRRGQQPRRQRRGPDMVTIQPVVDQGELRKYENYLSFIYGRPRPNPLNAADFPLYYIPRQMIKEESPSA